MIQVFIVDDSAVVRQVVTQTLSSDPGIEVIGSEATYGPHSRTADAREVVVKIAAKHDQKEALSLLGREIAPMSTGGVVGMAGSFGAGRVSPSPVIRMFSYLVPKSMVPVTVEVDGRAIPMQEGARSGGFTAASLPTERPPSPPLAAGDTASVPLIALAYGRSGDKGDNANIGIFARKPEYEPILDSEMTEEAVAKYFAHRIKGKVTRWRLPGIKGFNFLLRQALGGGGMAWADVDHDAWQRWGREFSQRMREHFKEWKRLMKVRPNIQVKREV